MEIYNFLLANQRVFFPSSTLDYYTYLDLNSNQIGVLVNQGAVGDEDKHAPSQKKQPIEGDKAKMF